MKTLYNLVNVACLKEGESFSGIGDFPSFIQIGNLPFSRLYLVSREKEKTENFAEMFNELLKENSPGSTDLKTEVLSRNGVLRFYWQRYMLGNLSGFLGESTDLDVSEGRIICQFGADAIKAYAEKERAEERKLETNKIK